MTNQISPDPNSEALARFFLDNINRKKGWEEYEGLVCMPKVAYYLWDFRFNGQKTLTRMEAERKEGERIPLKALALFKLGDRWYYNKSLATAPWWNRTCELIGEQVKNFRPVNFGAIMFAPDENLQKMVWGITKPNLKLFQEFARKWIGKEIAWSFPQEDKDDWYKFFAYVNSNIPNNTLS